MTPAEQLAVPCPREGCDAEVGETCEHEHAADGRPRSPHPERLVAARARIVAMEVAALPEVARPFAAEERAANQAAADGLPPRAIAVVRRILAAGGKVRGVGAHESTADQSAVCHIAHALAHLGDAGDDSLDGIDRDSGELSLAHAAARCLLALEVALAGKAGR